MKRSLWSAKDSVRGEGRDKRQTLCKVLKDSQMKQTQIVNQNGWGRQ